MYKRQRHATVDNLAREAGISKGAFYRFYESKEHLFLSMLERTHEEMYGSAEKILAERTDLPLRERTMQAILEVFRVAEKYDLIPFIREEVPLLLRRLPEEVVSAHYTTDDERIKLFQGHGNTLVHTTMERYSGSATGMDHYKGMPGLGVDKAYQLPSKYYAPMRLIAADIGNTGDYTLLVNKPISTAAQFFDRYRFFPQGEVHALYWDGVGLGLKWKPRRIRGSVAEIDLADVNNDGILVLCLLYTSPSPRD